MSSVLLRIFTYSADCLTAEKKRLFRTAQSIYIPASLCSGSCAIRSIYYVIFRFRLVYTISQVQGDIPWHFVTSLKLFQILFLSRNSLSAFSCKRYTCRTEYFVRSAISSHPKKSRYRIFKIWICSGLLRRLIWLTIFSFFCSISKISCAILSSRLISRSIASCIFGVGVVCTFIPV